MSQEFHATYEHGVLRLDAPLALPEQTRVTGIVSGVENSSNADDLERQQQALNMMFAAVEKLPQPSHDDNLSGRDHDQILYGSAK